MKVDELVGISTQQRRHLHERIVVNRLVQGIVDVYDPVGVAETIRDTDPVIADIYYLNKVATGTGEGWKSNVFRVYVTVCSLQTPHVGVGCFQHF